MNNKIDFNQIDEIKQKADIVSEISKYIKLTRRGANYFGICPFHADHNPSLVVSPGKKIWKCFVCGEKGNVFTFVQKYKKISFLEAVKQVAEDINFDISNLAIFNKNNFYWTPEKKRLVEANKFANELYKSFLFDKKNNIYLDYLKNRGFDEETIKYFEFGLAPNDKSLIFNILTNMNNIMGENRSDDIVWNEKELIDAGLITLDAENNAMDFLINRITIPIYDNNGYIVGFSGRTTTDSNPKYLNTGSTKIFSKGNLLFNFNRVKELQDKKIIIVEGFMDVISLHDVGYQNVVATMGVSLTEKHLNLLNSLELKTIILCFDNDSAGKFATIENGKKLMLNGFNVYVVGDYDSTIKDVDELIKKKSKTAVNSIINNRIDFISFLIVNKLNSSMPLDDLQINVNYLLEQIAEYGDVILVEKHLHLIEKISGLSFNDLFKKYNDLIKSFKTNSNNYFIKNFNAPKKNQNFNFDLEEESEILLKQKTKPNLKDHLYNFQKNIRKNELEQRFKKLMNELNAFLLKKNNFIRCTAENLAFSSPILEYEEVKIFKKIHFLFLKNNIVDYDALFNYVKNSNSTNLTVENVQSIKSSEEFMYFLSNKTSDRDNKKYNELMKNILNQKTEILKNKKLNDLELSDDIVERERQINDIIQLKDLINKVKK